MGAVKKEASSSFSNFTDFAVITLARRGGASQLGGQHGARSSVAVQDAAGLCGDSEGTHAAEIVLSPEERNAFTRKRT